MIATKNKIIKIVIKRESDPIWDLSHYGEYSNKLDDKFGIDRKKHDGYLDRNSYPYFNACNVETMEEAKQNYEIMKGFNNGDSYVIVIRAIAQIEVNNITQLIHSSGLGGIEASCYESKNDFKDIEDEQLEELKESLRALNFTDDEIEIAFKDVERKDSY